jgi:hypothetical protein
MKGRREMTLINQDEPAGNPPPANDANTGEAVTEPVWDADTSHPDVDDLINAYRWHRPMFEYAEKLYTPHDADRFCARC